MRFKTLSTDRLVLRNLESSDVDSMFEYRMDPQVLKYQNWDSESPADLQKFIEDLSPNGPDTRGEWFQFGIVLKETGELIGDCGLCPSIDQPSQFEIGITIAPVFQRMGFACEALTTIMDHLMFEGESHRVYASIDPENDASIALFQKLGFRKEAHFIESYWMKGRWVDDIVFGILHHEWLNLRKLSRT